MRQMEYDAEAAEIQLAGSDAFHSTMRKLGSMSVASSVLQQEMREMWQHRGQLPDNVPVLLHDREMQLPLITPQAIDHALETQKTGCLDTHPSGRDRLRFAQQLATSGGELSDGPARELFTDFEAISRGVTLNHYEANLRMPPMLDF